MRKIISKITGLMLGLSLAAGVGVCASVNKVSSVDAADTLVYTLTPSSGSNNSYAGNCDIEVNGVTWNLTGNSQMQPWRIGGKNLSGTDRSLYSKTAMANDISKIEVTHGSASSVTVNSWTVIVSSGADGGGTVVSTLTPTFETNKTTTIERPEGKSWANCYFKFVYNLTIGGSNKFVEFSEAKFYKTASEGDSTYHTVDFDVQGHGSQPSSQQVVDGGHASDPGDLSASGWIFGGWYKDADCGTAWNFTSDTISGTTTIYAKWTANVAPSGGSYTLVSSVSDLVNNDLVVIGTVGSTGPVNGITGMNSNGKDAAVSTTESEWVKYTVTLSGTGFTLADGTNFIYMIAKTIKYGDATVLSVTSNGYLCLASDSTTILYEQSTFIRPYQGKADTEGYTPYAVYKYGETIDPSLGTMTIKSSGAEAAGQSFNYKASGSYTFVAYDESTQVSGVSWSSSDETVATINASTGVLTTNKPGSVTITAEADGYNKSSAAITIAKGTIQSIVVSGAMTKTGYYVGESWDHSGLTATGTYSTGWQEDVSSFANWTYNPASPADGVTSVVATATIDEISDESSVQSVSVTVAHAGTAADPFTVAEGIAKAEEIGNKSSGEGPWVTTGIISDVVQVLTTGYQNARFHITEDGKTTSPSIYAFDCKYLNNAGFTEETAAYLVVGATVTITGNLLNYNNNTPEYARGCYLLDIKQPETGDVDVTFNPASTSFEIGATGTFTASSETSGAVFAWSVDDSSVLSVNSSTGAYEALALGVARVTVTASAGGKEGHTFVDFVVNGSANSYNTVSEANTIASGVTSGQTTAYYIYVEGYVKEFATSSKDGSPRAFDIMTLDEANSIMVYTNVNPYADFVSGLSLGDRIVVKGKIQNYSSKYEIVEPEKVASNASAITFAFDFISQTDDVCSEYDGVTDNSEAIGALWEGLSSSYSALYDNQKSILMGASRNEKGTHVEQAVARYDYLVGKYKLDNFITGRTPVVFAQSNFVVSGQTNTNSSTIVIVVVALTSITSIGVLLVIKRKRSLVK